MNEDQIRQLLQSHRRSEKQRRFRCPDEHLLAAYVDGKLSGKQRTGFEAHVSGCDSCLDALGFLTRSAEWTSTTEIPAYLVARARTLTEHKQPGILRWRWAFATAAAACVVLAVALIVLKSRVKEPTAPTDGSLIAQNQPTPESVVPTVVPEPPRPLPTRSVAQPNLNRGQASTVRGNESSRPKESEFKPVLLFPREGSVVRKGDLELRWRPSPDALRYEIRLITTDGSLRLVRETTETSLKLSAEELQTDTHYYLRIVAHTSDGRSTASEIVSFRLVKD